VGRKGSFQEKNGGSETDALRQNRFAWSGPGQDFLSLLATQPFVLTLVLTLSAMPQAEKNLLTSAVIFTYLVDTTQAEPI
jgi:hypothetical protein